ncbi:TPM domain-containing protein [Flagellimonas marina]|uniref:TPM domain-containing protein n=1 Tax=Flagellimonas marina TaxID=1775168 RepID=A0ABV8PPV2_9FLAO
MRKALFACFLVLVSAVCWSQDQYPQFTEIVTDNAEIFSHAQLEDLRAKLTQFETETTNQVVVLTIHELGSETIEQYANGAFNQNKLGQEGKDNGILILFSKLDREVRIEVGYGLEPYITDAVASRIIRNTMIPKFKEEDYYGGIDLATDQIIEFLKNPEALEEFNRQIEAEGEFPWWALILMTLFLSVFIAAGSFVFYKGYSNLVEMFRGIFIGKLGLLPGLFMLIPTLMMVVFGLVFVLMPLFFLAMVFGFDFDLDNVSLNTALFYVVPIGFFAVTITLAVIKILIKGKEDFKLSWVKSDSTYMSKTFSSGGSHSFGSSSGGSSSSSFSGGGGSSGGGGASGSW